MKICSTCQQKYSDSLEYCLQDGTVLAALPDPNATLRIDSRPTRSETRGPRSPPTFLFVAIGVVLLLGVLVVGAAVGIYVMSPNRSGTAVNTPADPAVRAADNSKPTDAAPTKDEISKKIEQLNEEITSALIHADLETLDRLMADDYHYENDLGQRFTKPQILSLFRSGNLHYEYLASTNSKMDVDDTLVKVLFTARAQAKGQINREPFVNTYTYTNRYEKRSSGWQLVSGRAWYR